ncbi:MAG: HugZ family protein [Paracoccaceae bacterium]
MAVATTSSADPFRATDDEARALARALLVNATHAALAVTRTDRMGPSVSRIALATAPDGAPVSLISSLAPHTAALETDPACSLLLGEAGEKGDPLTHPRLTLHCRVRFVEHDDPARDTLRAHYLSLRPKAKLYVDFTDFRFVRFLVLDGLLNGGFGKAYSLGPGDLDLTN